MGSGVRAIGIFDHLPDAVDCCMFCYVHETVPMVQSGIGG